MIDMHCHLIPGVDDGSSDINETRELLNMSWKQGVNTIIATPHFSHHTDFKKLNERLEMTREAARKIDSEFRIYLGQEILYFEGLTDWLDQGKALTLAKSRYVLVEFRPNDNYVRIQRAVHELISAGYLPIIAHIERYECLREKGKTAELIDYGAYLQINASSVLGGLFDRDARWCRNEIAQKRIHFIASDMHNTTSRPPRMAEAYKKIKKYGTVMQRQLFGINQKYILKDKTLKR